MIKEVTYDDTRVYVRLGTLSGKLTKAFTHGGWAFDMVARTLTMKDQPAVPLPEGLELTAGPSPVFQLVGPDGALRKQVRTGVLRESEKQPGVLRMAGLSRTPASFAAADGWRIEVAKYRAYFTHPGLTTDGEPPEWLQKSIARQRTFWNRLAWLCREARRKCSPLQAEAVVEFVKGTVLPSIDTFNATLERARSKEKIKHPANLQGEEPGVDALWRFAGQLRKKAAGASATPSGLLDAVVAFAEQFKVDYAPLNEFLAGLDATAKKEAEALGLRHFEIRPTVQSFKTVLKARKTRALDWSQGWPRIKYSDDPRAADWGLHFYFNKAGVDSALLETGAGVPGLIFGEGKTPAATNHPGLHCRRRSARLLREAEISICGDDGEKWTHRFGVLQHYPLPAGSHLKQWSLIYSKGVLRLCLVVERQRPLPVLGPHAAGLDIGWRRTEEGIRFGTLYEPESGTVSELIIDLQTPPGDHKARTPFRIDMGPTRWDRRNIVRLLPDWNPGDAIPNVIEVRRAIGKRRAGYKDAAKRLLQAQLGDRLPAWFDKAGSRGLLKLAEEFKDAPAVEEIVNDLRRKNEELDAVAGKYVARYARELEYGQYQVAHDVCRLLQAKGVAALIVEDRFVAEAAQQQDNDDHEALKRSQKYRQFAAVGRFVDLLRNTAVKHGIAVEAHDARNTTRICRHCNHLNPRTVKESYLCQNCGKQIKQDFNAAENLSRFATDPELAEMALAAGKA